MICDKAFPRIPCQHDDSDLGHFEMLPTGGHRGPDRGRTHTTHTTHKSTPHDRRTSPHLGDRQIICIRIDRTGQIYGHSPRTPPKPTLVASFLGYSNTFKLNWIFLWSIPVLVELVLSQLGKRAGSALEPAASQRTNFPTNCPTSGLPWSGTSALAPGWHEALSANAPTPSQPLAPG